jgi:DNA-binding transcriptional LysR family regulator
VAATSDLVRALAAAVGAPSLTSAARALGVDKATMSRRLAALERERPGLFERRGGRIEPTDAGRRALAVLADIDAGLARLDTLLATDDGTRGTVRLTVPAPIASHVIVPALPAFHASHPEVELVLLATSRVLDVARGEADVAVRNVSPAGGGITARRIAYVKAALYAARSYLARHGTPRGRSLAGHAFLDFEQGTYAGPKLEWLPAAVKEARVVLRADDPAILTRAAAAGLGVSALPGFLADDEPELVQLGEDESLPPVYLVVREDVRRLARVRAVAAWCAELLAAKLTWLTRPRA